ncbi:MAG: hypothetical protein IH599_07075, partial [Bacteroidales bacterium]|nr:hypothetical protein [Bacteroidales bacterium]
LKNQTRAAEEAFRLIYNLKFAQAREALKNPALDEPQREVLFADLMWWEAVAGVRADKFDAFLTALDQRSRGSGFWSTPAGRVTYHTYQVRAKLSVNDYLGALPNYYSLRKAVDALSAHEPDKAGATDAFLRNYKDALSLLENSRLPSALGLGRSTEAELLQRFERQSASGDLITSALNHYFLWKYYAGPGNDEAGRKLHAQALHQLFPDNRFFNPGGQVSSHNQLTNN